MKNAIKKVSRKRIWLILLICAIIIIFPLGMFVVARYRFWVVYGILDSLRKGENGLLSKAEYSEEQLRKVGIENDESVKYSNIMWIVNASNPTPDDIPFICEVSENVSLNSNIKADIDRLFCDVKELFGNELIITSAYRTRDFQAAIYKTNPYAVPAGTSEHETGLAADLKIDGYAQKRFVLSKVGRWVNENAYKYGFIIRYPFWGEDKTGVEYEPWHIRYVGFPHAQIIHRSHITLEEYVESFIPGEFYTFQNYVISRQTAKDGELVFPENFTDINVSPDNMGGWFIWGMAK